MTPQDFYNMFAPAAGLDPQQQAGQQAPLAFLGQQQAPQAQPQQQALGALGQKNGQQGGGVYGQVGNLIGGGIKSLLANYGANGSSNVLADAVGFQPFGGGGWGSGE